MANQNTILKTTLEQVAGAERTQRLIKVLEIPQDLLDEQGANLTRADIAQLLNMLLVEDLLSHVPDAKLYADDCLHDGRKIMHDHGPRPSSR